MILGIGIDIVEISRIERILNEYGEIFTHRIFTAGEIAYCERKKCPAIYYAARFAAKEAFLKALGTGLSGGIRWRDIEIVNNTNGKPAIVCHGIASECAKKMGAEKIDISISHSREYAVATAIVSR